MYWSVTTEIFHKTIQDKYYLGNSWQQFAKIFLISQNLTTWANSPPPASPLTQIPHYLLVSSFKFPTTCWPPHSNSLPPAGHITQIPHHMLRLFTLLGSGWTDLIGDKSRSRCFGCGLIYLSGGRIITMLGHSVLL